MISSLKNWFETLLTVTLAVTPQVIPHTQHGFDYNISFKIGTQQNITSNIETIKPQKKSSSIQKNHSKSSASTLMKELKQSTRTHLKHPAPLPLNHIFI